MTKRKPRKGRPAQPKDKPMEVALAARMKHTGLPEALAKHQEAATELGRLWLRGVISLEQRMAGEALAKMRRDAMSAMEAPVGFIHEDGKPAVDWDAKGFDRETYTDLAIKAVGKWEAFKAMVPYVVLKVCIDDVPCTDDGLLGLGLSDLAKRLGIIREVA